ncbi:hypothetical protein [Burkholderia cenocepacia]|uniref:hypothetical protein n=1 Tax=Burkholderia cenocepacia TaxID=95486 RepID=UPI00190745A5|nr:hypothetical protein [Burkholderia cenocepacia]MBJ9895240.1 hypothetical protein [Burkholderia cenocepacia]MBJ9917656.1 hypothetical protein [Burkholderia cenocepacia]
MCDILGAIGSLFGGGKASSVPTTASTTTANAASSADAQAAQAANAQAAADKRRRAAGSLLSTGAGTTGDPATSSSVLASAKSSLGQ